LKEHDKRRALVTRAILVGIAAAGMVVAGLAGCSNKSNTSSSSGSAEKVTIDGQNQNITGQTSCTPAGGNLNIAIGDPTNGIGAVITTANPPAVQSVGLGNVNGVTLGYAAGAPNQGNVQATKDGNSYTIKGTATGVNMASPQQPVTRPFEMDVTCP
jgi:ipoprotein LpqH